MTEDCGHRCCDIRTNGYHVHASEPDDCERCDQGVSPRAAITGQTPAVTAGAGDGGAAPGTSRTAGATLRMSLSARVRELAGAGGRWVTPATSGSAR